MLGGCLGQRPARAERGFFKRFPSFLLIIAQISLPLVSKTECEARLRPEFRSRGVNSWDLHSSEICAGGEPGVDSCDGEGGAPLVCLDEVGLKEIVRISETNAI